MMEPRLMSAGSVMPNYPWLASGKVDFEQLPAKLRAMQMIGIPYTDEQIQNAGHDARTQAAGIAAGLAGQGEAATEDQELIAVIAYLQRLGVDGRNWDKENNLTNPSK